MRKLLVLFWLMVPVVAVNAAPVVPSAVLHGVETVSSGGDIMVDAIESRRVPSTPVRWQIVRPAVIPKGMDVLQLDSDGITNAVLILRRPPDGSYLIAGTVYGSPDASGTPTAATSAVEVRVGLAADLPHSNPIPPPVPPPEVTPSIQDIPPVVVPATVKLHAIFVYTLPDPSHSTKTDLAVAALVASPTLRPALARLGVEWVAWDSNRPELVPQSVVGKPNFGPYFSKGSLPLLLVFDLEKPKATVYDQLRHAVSSDKGLPFTPPLNEADIIDYFAKLRGK